MPRRWATLASLALAVVLLPAASPAEAHSGRRQHGYHRSRHGNHGHGHHGHGGHYYRENRYHDHGHHAVRPHHGYYRPARVYYHRRHYAPIYFYLATPYVVVHRPGIAAHVVYYPGEVPLYEPGYCPAEVHYHPYHHEAGVHGSVSVHVGF